MVVYLDGQLITGPIDGAEGSIFTEQRVDEDGRMSRNYSASLTFYDDGFTIIRAKLIEPLDGKNAKINVRVVDECCLDSQGAPSVLFQGIIRGDSIDWCEGECLVTATMFEETEETEAMDCIKSTLVWDDWDEFKSNDHPRVRYCIELRPSIFQDLIIIFGALLNTLMIILFPIVAIISAIIRVVAAIPGVNLSDELEDGVLDDYKYFRDRLNESIIGCGRVHPSPLVREYILNVCGKCGLTFESSILNDTASDYYNLVYMYAPVEKGAQSNLTTPKYISQNQPNKTLEGFLDELKPVFNAQYVVKGGVLYFERRDKLNVGNVWFEYEGLKAQGRIIEEPCYEWRDEFKHAALSLGYTPDPVDWVGNEALPYYNTVVGVNEPPSTLQKGVKDVTLGFGAVRFRDDYIDVDVLGRYSWLGFIGKAIAGTTGAVIMNNGTCFQPKLIIWDGASINNAKAKKYGVSDLVDIFAASNSFKDFPIDKVGHNWPMQFNTQGVEVNTVYEPQEEDMGLYGRFYTIDHPRVNNDRGLGFTMKIKYGCEIMRGRDIYNTITLPLGEGRIRSMGIDPEEQTITITGEL